MHLYSSLLWAPIGHDGTSRLARFISAVYQVAHSYNANKPGQSFMNANLHSLEKIFDPIRDASFSLSYPCRFLFTCILDACLGCRLSRICRVFARYFHESFFANVSLSLGIHPIGFHVLYIRILLTPTICRYQVSKTTPMDV